MPLLTNLLCRGYHLVLVPTWNPEQAGAIQDQTADATGTRRFVDDIRFGLQKLMFDVQSLGSEQAQDPSCVELFSVSVHALSRSITRPLADPYSATGKHLSLLIQ